ncbi:rhomboid family intramembrane serine protease [Nitratireductor pacificus]|uniref:Rhomboid family protein n=1 Tax=Nitratireductor pacificus pht-3B TaxID=391937 RepID=K2M8J0_9HYPH|nr:rhomboid family intramembrane serine protease [Nitratireductor pacificus]EKF17290.1 Rhomboid family protein [Nitratireductor pacificus pht-3B]
MDKERDDGAPEAGPDVVNDIPNEAGEPPRREPVFNLAPVVTVFALACIGIFALQALWLGPQGEAWLILRFAFLPIRYTGPYLLDAYAAVSPLTYSFLHGGIAHLAVNMIWLAAFGSPLANRIGAMRFVLFWGAGALAAAGLHFVLHPLSAAPLVGASGAISAMMGAAARFAFQVDRRQPKPSFAGPVWPIPMVLRSRTVLVFLAVWMVVNLVTGLGVGASPDSPQIAWEAHIGGFLLGFFAIRLFDR